MHPYVAMILAAGRGERMRPLTDTVPKPLLKAGKHALIEYQIMALANAGFTDIIVNHAYLGDMIEHALGTGSHYGVNIHYSAEKTVLETAGGIANAMPLLTINGKLPFLVVNADIFCNMDYASLLPVLATMRIQTNRVAHLALIDNPPHHAEGDFALQQDHVKLTGANKLTFSGIGVYQPRLFDNVQPGQAVKLSVLLKQAIRDGAVSGEYFSGTWIDIGTPERLLALDQQLKSQSLT
ncbi:MAG: nucleotidyltransferase family protein [Nitrosomonas sp.]|nr:MAG: nucleotidyltransferase family protein [Nitrosomonas sp.]